ncbi:MAG: hypothetical protein ACKV2T_19330 [Kofleriaceae bacterium]
MKRTPHLLSILVLPLLVVGCSSDVSTKGQLISCETDPGTGVILSCTPGEDDDPTTCTDVDENGDGDCDDEGEGEGSGSGGLSFAPTEDGESDDDDDDDDGVPDEDDCDEHPGEDGDDDESDVDLPYDIKMTLGETYTPIADAFAEKGAQPAAILSVTGATWRATELQAGTSFTVGQADCDHAGNRDVGRDRVIVTWMNTDGSMDADHLDLRYCE